MKFAKLPTYERSHAGEKSSEDEKYNFRPKLNISREKIAPITKMIT